MAAAFFKRRAFSLGGSRAGVGATVMTVGHEPRCVLTPENRGSFLAVYLAGGRFTRNTARVPLAKLNC